MMARLVWVALVLASAFQREPERSGLRELASAVTRRSRTGQLRAASAR